MKGGEEDGVFKDETMLGVKGGGKDRERAGLNVAVVVAVWYLS